MDALERDSTRDWLLPEKSRPPLLGELEERIDEALATARAAEAAVISVGASALDAAEQARRAAGLAERASAAMLAAAPRRVSASPSQPAGPPPSTRSPDDDGLRDFTARADRLAARLRELQRSSLATAR